MNGINPKIDWHAGDGITAGDLNYIGNQSWEQVYGCFDLQGIIKASGPLDSPLSFTGYVSVLRLQMPPNTKLILTHANYSYIDGVANPNGAQVNIVGSGSPVIFPSNNNVWDINVAPILTLNDTSTTINIVVELKINGFSGSVTGDLAMFARVIIVPNA